MKSRSILISLLLTMVPFLRVEAQDGFRVYPYLQNPSSNAMTVIWFSEVESPGLIKWQKLHSGGETQMFSIPTPATTLAYSSWEDLTFFNGEAPAYPYKHRVRLEGLESATTYKYTVEQGPESFSSIFKTSPHLTDTVRFIAYADSETEPESHGNYTSWVDPVSGEWRQYLVDQSIGYQNNLDVIQSRDPDLVLIAGDLVESGGEQRDWDEFWLHNTNHEGDSSLASSIPILTALGNHEYSEGPYLDGFSQPGSERAIQRYLTYFEAPLNNSPNEEEEGRYYCINYGPVTFIVLDVCNNGINESGEDTNFFLLGESDVEGGNAPDFSPGSRQYLWLQQQLSINQNTSLFTFVVFHHSPYSSGPHGKPPGTGDLSDRQSGVPVRMLTPLFMQYGVDAVFSGHDEMWERSKVSGYEVKSDGKSVKHEIHFFDVGIGGDGLRGPIVGLENLFQEFLVHTDVPELWNEGILVEGGKHYGHMEVDIITSHDNFWQAAFSPAYVLPTWNSDSLKYLGYERKIYNDQFKIFRTISDGMIWDCELVGNTDVYNSTTTVANRRAIPVTFSESGTIESITIYHNGGGGKMLLGVYSDVSGSPGLILGETPSSTVSASAGWQTVNLSNPVSVAAGQTVWLAWVFENNPGIRYTSGTPARAHSSATWSGGMPATFGEATYANYNYSLYCTYIPSASLVYLDVSPSSVSLEHESGSSGIFSITSNTSWSITSDASWLNLSSTSGLDDGTVTATAISANTGSSPRSATVTISGLGVPDRIVTVTQEASPTSSTLGNTELFGTTTTAANRRAVPVTASEAGMIESITIYHNGGSGSLLLGVYSDASGSPDSRLGISLTTAVNSSEGWQTVNLSSPVSVTAGQTVWLAWVFESNPGIRYKTGTPGRANSPGTWSGGMPSSFGSSTMANYIYSIYCTYTPGSSMTGTLGNTEVFGTSTTVANRRAVPIMASEAGSIESISIYHNGGDGGMLLGVYSDASGLPDSRLGISLTTTVSSSEGWQTVNLSSPVLISAGQTVWLSWVFESNPGIRYSSGAPARAHSTATWSGGMPTSFGSSTMANYIYSVYCTYTPGSSMTGTLGNTEVFGTSTTAANRRAVSVTASEAGSIESISMYHEGGSGGMLLGVYADASGLPGTRLSVTSTTTVSGSSGWQTVDLVSPVDVTAGQTVWLAWVFESNPGIRYEAGTPGRANSPATWSGGMPTSFGSSSIADYIYSIYCTYSTGGAKAASSSQLANIPDNQDNVEDQFIVYPNPTTGKLTFKWNYKYESGLVLSLVNSTGQTMKVLNIEPGPSEVELDLGDYNAGLYLILFSDTNEQRIVHRAKVIKSK